MPIQPALFLFDVFGTVVDWRTSVAKRLTVIADDCGINMDCQNFADRWRGLYQPIMEGVRSGERSYELLDNLHRENLLRLLDELSIPIPDQQTIERMNNVWAELDGWPDASEGVKRLKSVGYCVSLSNGNIGLMSRLARYADLPWDAIMGAEVAKDYKPKPGVYLSAAKSFGLNPEQCVMVAAHNYDLAAARELGMQAAFIPRPTEYGPGQTTDLTADQDWEYTADSLTDLAAQFGA